MQIIAPKLAFTINELSERHSGGRTKIYAAIADGSLIARKQGRSTIILESDYVAFLQALPKIPPKRTPLTDEAGGAERT